MHEAFSRQYVHLPITDWKDDVILEKEVNPPRPGLNATVNLFRSTAAVFNKQNKP